MKSFVICRSTGKHSPHDDLRAQTRPSGDIEFVSVGTGVGENRPAQSIVGVISRSDIPALIEFLKQNS